MKALLWYRNDLRTEDHPAIQEAFSKDYEVLPLYIFDEPHAPFLPINLAPASGYRKKFLIESVLGLKKALAQKGVKLLILRGPAHDIIPKLCIKYGISIVLASKEYAPYENTSETTLDALLQQNSISLKLFHSSLLINPAELPFSIQDLPDIFTNFRKAIESKTNYPSPIQSTFPSTFINHQESSIALESLQEKTKHAIHFEGGEIMGLKRIQHYLWDSNSISMYKETRNEMLGIDYSSKFSPWLALGCISPRQIVAEIGRYEKERIANESTYWLVFELLWRDYFKFAMMKYGRLFFLKHGLNKRKTIGEFDLEKFELWKEGKTGNDFIDANMLELKSTGFMSNRGRQNVASYLVHDLNVDWRLGAAYFEQMLIDYDVCSNWCNWAYVAGVGNDPRENRKFNPEKQAQMYDPKGDFVKTWLNK